MLNAIDIILGIVTIFVAIAIIILVLMQEGKKKGMSGAISGGNDSYLSKGKTTTSQAKAKRFTFVLAIVFFVLVVVLNVINFMTRG